MKSNISKLLKAAVVTGFMAGTAAKADHKTNHAAQPAGEGVAKAAEKNACKGKGGCEHKGNCGHTKKKGKHAAKGKNSCKAEHKNACKGKGGCSGEVPPAPAAEGGKKQ